MVNFELGSESVVVGEGGGGLVGKPLGVGEWGWKGFCSKFLPIDELFKVGDGSLATTSGSSSDSSSDSSSGSSSSGSSLSSTPISPSLAGSLRESLEGVESYINLEPILLFIFEKLETGFFFLFSTQFFSSFSDFFFFFF